MSNLKIIATPIGNLGDISFRACQALKNVDYILCEDTRVSKKLLDYYKISTPTISYHQHSSSSKLVKIIDLLRTGKNLALISDAGTPGISDPGSSLVSLVRERLGDKVKIESLPGASALTTAIAISGKGFDRFLFLGFLPHKKGRQTLLKEIMFSKYPVVVYESKHRIIKLLQELEHFSLANKKSLMIGLARELTKLHENFYQGSISDILNKLSEKTSNLKGEFVVLIHEK